MHMYINDYKLQSCMDTMYISEAKFWNEHVISPT